jgi:hypothetical protein
MVVTNGQEHTTGMYEAFLDGIIAAQVEYVEVMAGDAIQLGMLTLVVLGPVSLTSDLNNGYFVLRLVYGDVVGSSNGANTAAPGWTSSGALEGDLWGAGGETDIY